MDDCHHKTLRGGYSKKQPPQRIWLQYVGADAEGLSEQDLITPAPEITWCVDKIFDTDIEYVLAEKKDGKVKVERPGMKMINGHPDGDPMNDSPGLR